MNNFDSSLDFSKNFEPEKNIQEEDFVYFQSLFLKLAGIFLSEKKRDLLKTRLGPYLRKNNFLDYGAYISFLKGLPDTHPEWQNLINLMTTNKTDFFREPAHFDFIETTIIPQWVNAGKTEVHIWSSASSSGEEAYTLAMFLEKKLPKSIMYKILATDIDTAILNRGQNGVYSILKENEIPLEYRSDSIDYGTRDIKSWFRVKIKLKSNITFKQHNLIEDTLPSEQMFDLILCRNVMIYFPKDIVEKVANKLYKACHLEGYLFIGHSESLQASNTSWLSSAPSVYKKSNSYKKRR